MLFTYRNNHGANVSSGVLRSKHVSFSISTNTEIKYSKHLVMVKSPEVGSSLVVLDPISASAPSPPSTAHGANPAVVIDRCRARNGSHLRMALSNGINCFIVGSIQDVRDLAAYSRDVSILIAFNFGSATDLDYGVNLETLGAALKEAKRCNIHIEGQLHIHDTAH
jgi:hypothetical protein